MLRKKLVTLSLLSVATVISALALVSAPAPANACLWLCTTGYCTGGKLHAKNYCTGQTACVSACTTE